MSERNYEDLVPHIKKDELLNDAELAFKDYIADVTTVKDLKYFTNKEQYFTRALKEAYISGWNQHQTKCKNLYSIEDIKNIIN